MESPNSMSSCESLYSVDSAASDEEDKCYDFGVFLSDSESEVEKEAGGLSRRRDACSGGERNLFSPKSAWTSPSLPGRDCKRRTAKPTLQSSARQRPSSQCGRFSGALEGRYPSACAYLMDGDGSLAGRILSQKRVESGRKRLIRPTGDREYPKYAEKPAVHGLKRQRNGETEMKEAPTLPLTDGDRLFAQKCRELQGFIRPLAELLNGLKKGRYERGLSSFQRSVAMDRIQRIVGVLQKPEMGERYLGTLLQVEMMLKVWFPHVALNSSCPDSNPAEHARKLAKQSHPKPSAVDSYGGKPAVPSEDSAQNPAVEKLHHTDPAAANGKADAVWREQACFLADWSAMNLTWMHTSPICNPPLGLANLGHLNAAFSQALLGPNACGVILFLHNNLAAPAPFFRSTSVTPDKSSPAFCHPKQPPGTGDPPRCQSLPGAMAAGSYVLSQHPGSHSKSLPHLPISSKEPKPAAAWTGNRESELLARKGPVYSS
ncbi:circadian-associated transcriptional repressor isoform X2 [Mauremys reevesii]|nr:circadian-associated transcriptional repressor isoform X2 [Mauremys reevesii]XP_039369525.1 circadian-associated transcriptional repressor isoform X2 [Mauremys reevesii]XP_039369526.1 circadian-associated transcriptional repressor isoform X2 [Mauremys reevesii]